MRYDATSASAIEATGLIKRFGKTTALAGVDLVAREGRVLGVLGPNGAGQTTAVRILATLLRPDGGQARVCGYDVLRNAYQVCQLIGLTGQYASTDEGLSGTNNLIMIGRLLGLPRAPARARARGHGGRGGAGGRHHAPFGIKGLIGGTGGTRGYGGRPLLAAQDAQVHLLELSRGVDAEPASQQLAGLVVDLEGLGLAARGVQGAHEQGAGTFGQRVGGQQRAQLADQTRSLAEG
jgi:hypothetical protein